MLCWMPMVALLGVVTLPVNAHHETTMHGVQLEAQSCVTGFGVYATALSSELYTGGIQYGYPVRVSEAVTVIGQVYGGASYTSRWVMELVDHPAHYGGKDNPYEAIRVIEAWGLGFCLGNAVKYLARAGKKPGAAEVEDLEKARWYLDRHIAELKKGQS